MPKSNRGGLISYGMIVPILCILSVATINHLSGFQQTAMLYATYALPFTIFMFTGTFFYFHLRTIIGSATLVLGVIACIFGFSISLAAHPALKTLATSSYVLAVIVFTLFYFARDSFKANRILDALADISYPLYAVHAISGYGIMYILDAKGAPPWLASCAGFFLALTLAYILHHIVERPSMRLGKQLAKKLYPKVNTTHA